MLRRMEFYFNFDDELSPSQQKKYFKNYSNVDRTHLILDIFFAQRAETPAGLKLS
jgi:50S ribosomal subunit-associated GTPase HflX